MAGRGRSLGAPDERDAWHGHLPFPAVRLAPGHLLVLALVEDQAERAVLQRQVRDELRHALPDGVVADELSQADLRGTAQRLADPATQRVGIPVSLPEQG